MFLRRISPTLFLSRWLFSSKTGLDFISAIDELNKGMEYVFGEPPPADLAGSSSTRIMDLDLEIIPPKVDENGSGLTHIGSKGEAQMVDISAEEIDKRLAVASCKVMLGKKVFDLVSDNQIGKGDALSVAKIAGINGAKQTSKLIPMYHNINLTHVWLDLSLNPLDYSVEIQGWELI